MLELKQTLIVTMEMFTCMLTAAGERYNSRDEGFTSYSKPLGKLANDTINSFIRDMANEQDPVNQVYTWGASADCDQIQ